MVVPPPKTSEMWFSTFSFSFLTPFELRAGRCCFRKDGAQGADPGEKKSSPPPVLWTAPCPTSTPLPCYTLSFHMALSSCPQPGSHPPGFDLSHAGGGGLGPPPLGSVRTPLGTAPPLPLNATRGAALVFKKKPTVSNRSPNVLFAARQHMVANGCETF